MSSGNDFRGPWNSGETTVLGETIQFIDDPIQHVLDTNGLLDQQAAGTERSDESVQTLNQELSLKKSNEIKAATKTGLQSWNDEMMSDEYKRRRERRFSGNDNDLRNGENAG